MSTKERILFLKDKNRPPKEIARMLGISVDEVNTVLHPETLITERSPDLTSRVTKKKYKKSQGGRRTPGKEEIKNSAIDYVSINPHSALTEIASGIEVNPKHVRGLILDMSSSDGLLQKEVVPGEGIKYTLTPKGSEYLAKLKAK